MGVNSLPNTVTRQRRGGRFETGPFCHPALSASAVVVGDSAVSTFPRHGGWRRFVGVRARYFYAQFIDVKTFFTFFYFGHFLRFYRFLFSKRFLLLKNVGKVQSSKQINKKHFQNNSNETDL